MNLAAAWARFWFSNAEPLGLIATRSIAAVCSLWMVLSRPALTEVLAWPSVAGVNDDPMVRLRFLSFTAISVERLLYWLLVTCLIAVLIGALPRLCSFISAGLLYHFAAFSNGFHSPSSLHLEGWTFPLMALAIVSFAHSVDWKASPSPEWRWPVLLAQLPIVASFFFAGISKISEVGWRWFAPDNMAGLVAVMARPGEIPPWAETVHDSAGSLVALAILMLFADFAPLIAFLFRRSAWFLVPTILVTHLIVWQVFGAGTASWPMLLIFLDWDRIARWGQSLTSRRAAYNL